MGAVLAILGSAGDAELESRLDRMLARSPYRGAPEKLLLGPLAIAIQSMGWDASLASSGNWTIAFHGYVGNWADLDSQFSWRLPRNASDALKVSIAIETLGDKLCPMLRGEWAMLAWDRNRQELVAARDVMGCRPLYWQAADGRYYLASEICQVQRGAGRIGVLDNTHLAKFMMFSVENTQETVWKDISRVPAGHLVVFSAGYPVQDRTYWRPPRWDGSAGREGSFEDTARAVAETMRVAVERAIPKGSFSVALSGGLDSSGIWGWIDELRRAGHPSAALAVPVSWRFPGLPCDEGEFIEACWRKCGITGVVEEFDAVRTIDLLHESATRLDSPFFSTVFLLPLLCSLSQRHVNPIMLTGDGGDMLFDPRHGYLAHEFVSLQWRALAEDLPRHGEAWGMARGELFVRHILRPLGKLLIRFRPQKPSWLSECYWDAVVSSCSSRSTPMGSLSRLAMGEMLDFLELDRSGCFHERMEQLAASYGGELRHPLLDLDVVELLLALPPRYSISLGIRRSLQRAAIGPVIPRSILRRRSEAEFSPIFDGSVAHWLQSNPPESWELVGRGILSGSGLSHLINGGLRRGKQFDWRCHFLVACEMYTRSVGNAARRLQDEE